MFHTLRSRLIISHILPFLIIIPLIGISLLYFLERQFLLPQLSVELGVDARLLADIVRYQPELLQDPELAQAILQTYYQASDAQLMLLNSAGDPIRVGPRDNQTPLEDLLDSSDLSRIKSGEVVTRMDSSTLKPVREIEVLAPVLSSDQQMLGIVRLTYSFESVVDRLLRLRTWIISIVLLGLVVGILLGSILAVTISRPIQQATTAVNRVAQGHFEERLPINDPQELRQLAEAVNYLVDRLQNLEQARQKLLANLVHELGRPLGAIGTAIQALRRGATQDTQLASDLLGGMEEETSRLQHLLDDLNGLYDKALGTLELDQKSVNLNEWLPKVLSPWQESAQAKGIHWENIIIANLPIIEADPLRLGQALGNLASNAIKYTPPGGSVTFTANQNDEELTLSFSDTGPGITKDEQEKIFRPFYQGENGRRAKQGMGLGLSIALDLIQAHNGKLDLTSQPGIGSQFTIRLPKKI